jgi:indolepyruvate ferredoxin oxidoreductase beta subunit
MSVTSIMIAGVGGQGLVLATRIVASVALAEGCDVKTGDVVGLAQRGGMVWGSVRFGEVVHSPLIPAGSGDFMLAMEALEGLRWAHLLKPGATVLLNNYSIFPNRVLLEKDVYPEDVPGLLKARGLETVSIDAETMAEEMGNRKLANTILLGALSASLPFPVKTWQGVISENVPPKTVELNLKAFDAGRDAATSDNH